MKLKRWEGWCFSWTQNWVGGGGGGGVRLTALHSHTPTYTLPPALAHTPTPLVYYLVHTPTTLKDQTDTPTWRTQHPPAPPVQPSPTLHLPTPVHWGPGGPSRDVYISRMSSQPVWYFLAQSDQVTNTHRQEDVWTMSGPQKLSVKGRKSICAKLFTFCKTPNRVSKAYLLFTLWCLDVQSVKCICKYSSGGTNVYISPSRTHCHTARVNFSSEILCPVQNHRECTSGRIHLG